MLLAKSIDLLLACGALGVMLPAAMATRCWAEDPAPGKQVEQQKTVRNSQGQEVTVRYWLYLPKEYDGNQSFPLVLFLHGAGERGDDLKLVTKWGPPKLVAEGKHFLFILVSPQCPARQWWDADTLAHLVDDLAGSLKVDKERMYVTGLSMGGFGTWAILAKHPNLFAAAVPICGGGDPATAEAIKHIPIWAFHGAKDNVVPLERSQQMVDAIKRVGGNAKLTVYPEAGHNSWSETYDNPEVYRWLLEHRRQ